ncbi:tetrahydrobiopterin biosynthesis enzymes-like protein [Zopfia rhizophila CBS 207.26]|uniref:dihydroneopterin aldolase n=1 Tax=Zopfia rhizophila CBS 207.26 TaxID=1314779 RepID=A0A6A6DTG2_9PEZI|nr:tetrahydrobiopterin biosynthesis enzymes-like protein [Zopfia rhizophila CBS 207.26]
MSLRSSNYDTVFLLNFPYQIIVGKDAWQRSGIPQPVIVSFCVAHDLERAGSLDDMEATIDYDKLYHEITAVLTSPGKVFRDIQDLSATITGCYPAVDTTDINDPLGNVGYTLSIKLPKGVLRAEGGLKYTQTMNTEEGQAGHGLSQSLSIENIKCDCIVGANQYERSIKQPVVMDIEVMCRRYFPDNPSTSMVVKVLNCYHEMVSSVCEKVDASSFRTLEALATSIAREIIENFGVEVVTVGVEKPSAIANVQAAGVRITRSRSWFASMRLPTGIATSAGEDKA